MAASLQLVRRTSSPELEVQEVVRREEVAQNGDGVSAVAYVARGMFDMAGQAIQASAQCAVAAYQAQTATVQSMQEVSIAAMETGAEHHRAANALATAALRTTESQHQQVVATLQKEQAQHRDERAVWMQQQQVREGEWRAMQLQQQLDRELERDEHAEDVLLLHLDRARGGFESIRLMPDQAAAFAEFNVGWIGKLQSELKQKRQAKLDEERSAADKLAREEKEKRDAIAREARENQERIENEKRDLQVKKEQEERQKLERATSQSQQGRIDLAQRSIKQVVSSLRSARDSKICVIFCLCVAPIATAYVNPKLGIAAACIAYPVAYYMHSRLPEMYAKIKWMEIYEQSLDILKSNPHYTVRHAVSQQIHRELALNESHKPKIDQVLGKISEERVQGDPRELLATIPEPLQALIVHAQHPPRHFLAISLV